MPSSLEQLAAQLLGEDMQSKIREENPYYDFANLGSSIGDIAMKAYSTRKDPTQDDLWDAAIVAALGGALSGGLKGLGNDYQNTLTDRFLQTALSAADGQTTSPDLPAGLFNLAARQGKLFKLVKDLENANAQRDVDLSVDKASRIADAQAAVDVKKSLLEAAIRRTSLGTMGDDKEKEPSSPEEALLREEGKEALRLQQRYGITPDAASRMAAQAFTAKRQEAERSYKKVEDAAGDAEALEQLANRAAMALADVGHTGFAGETVQGLAGALSAFGAEGQEKKFSAGKQIEALSSEVIKLMGRPFKGPMSDRDVQIMLRSAPSLTNDPETNRLIVDKWRYAAKVQRDYVDFMRAARDKGASVVEAETEWDKIKKANPYILKTDGGGYIVNPDWQNFSIGTIVGAQSAPSVSLDPGLKSELIRRGLIK